MQAPNRPTGMFGFTLVWLGQMISVLATNMSAFALTIWVFEKTGSATALGLMQVFFITPLLIITPFAGVMVDRHNRKMMLMISDLVAGLLQTTFSNRQSACRVGSPRYLDGSFLPAPGLEWDSLSFSAAWVGSSQGWQVILSMQSAMRRISSWITMFCRLLNRPKTHKTCLVSPNN